MNIDTSQFPLWLHAVIVIVVIGLIAKGASWLVEAAARIAQRLGISELIIGLTVVAFGTSAPEFAVTILAAFRGQGDISVGNVVGSNIFNLGFILGGCAIAHPIPTSKLLVYRDGAVLLIGTILVGTFVGLDLQLTAIDGAILFSALVAYLAFLFVKRGEGTEPDEELKEILDGAQKSHLGKDVLILFGGLAAIVGGSHFLVISASAIARHMGLSEWIIGVTIVAAGTSAPEFATTMAGLAKKKFAMSAGNVIGSDIFNIFGVLGLAGMIQPLSVEINARSSLVGLTAMVVIVLVFMRTGWKISRLQGGALVMVALGRWFLDFSTLW
jgi:cation:H+ antiporter